METCRVCGEPFARASYRDLHLAGAHPAAATAGEQAAAHAAEEAEEQALAELRCHVKAGLVVLPMAVIYLVIILMAHIGGIPIVLGFLLLPGIVAMAGFTYKLQHDRERERLDASVAASQDGDHAGRREHRTQ